GRLDSFYANLGHRVNKRGADDSISNYLELFEAAEKVLPGDAEFESEFADLRVRVGKMARYYLRSLESQAQQLPEPGWVPNSDPQAVTVEHIMPRKLPEESEYSQQDIETHGTRLGNLALLQSSENVKVDRKPFRE